MLSVTGQTCTEQLYAPTVYMYSLEGEPHSMHSKHISEHLTAPCNQQTMYAKIFKMV